MWQSGCGFHSSCSLKAAEVAPETQTPPVLLALIAWRLHTSLNCLALYQLLALHLDIALRVTLRCSVAAT
jgi:hypothetical protein